MKHEFRDFTTHSAVRGRVARRRCQDGRLPYEKIEMLVMPTAPSQNFDVVGRAQSLLSYPFTDEKLNPILNESLFHFTIPPSAQVVYAVAYKSQDWANPMNQ